MNEKVVSGLSWIVLVWSTIYALLVGIMTVEFANILIEEGDFGILSSHGFSVASFGVAIAIFASYIPSERAFLGRIILNAAVAEAVIAQCIFLTILFAMWPGVSILWVRITIAALIVGIFATIVSIILFEKRVIEDYKNAKLENVRKGDKKRKEIREVAIGIGIISLFVIVSLTGGLWVVHSHNELLSDYQELSEEYNKTTAELDEISQWIQRENIEKDCRIDCCLNWVKVGEILSRQRLGISMATVNQSIGNKSMRVVLTKYNGNISIGIDILNETREHDKTIIDKKYIPQEIQRMRKGSESDFYRWMMLYDYKKTGPNSQGKTFPDYNKLYYDNQWFCSGLECLNITLDTN